MKRKLAIIGAGNVACKSYLPYLVKRDDVELIIQSRTWEKATSAAERFGGRAVKTLEEVAAEKPDVAFILTREHAHIDISNALVDLGVRRLFIEKPLNARNGQGNVTEEDYFEAAGFLKHAKETGCEVAMNFNYRFYEISRKLRSIIAERHYGELRECSMMVNYACWSHCIDLLRFFGGRIKTVTALGEKKTNADLAGAFFLENGGTGTILGTVATNFAMSLYYVVLNFEKAIVTFEDLDSEMSIYETDTKYRETYRLFGNFSRWNQYTDSFAKSVEAYLASIDRGEKPPVTGEDGLVELQFEAALRRSAALGHPVDFADMNV
jgi:predicted dehydrogenase